MRLLNVVISCTLAIRLKVRQTELAPYYHSTDDIHRELLDLQSRCPGFTMTTESRSNVSIDVVSIRKPGAAPKLRTFMLFGEHSRELVSSESGLHFIKSLCGETDVEPGNQLEHTEYMIIVNANPDSRRKVEQGEYCLRVNGNGVDLNRNWDEHWSASSDSEVDTNPGPYAFSEGETKVFRDSVTNFNPTTFLTIHSGTKGMYMPWAYDREHLAQRNKAEMMQLLRELDEDYCQCPYGAAGREVGYSCPGTCLDYVYDKLQTEYAFAFEIYTDPDEWDDLKNRFEENRRRVNYLQTRADVHNLAHKSLKSLFTDHPSDFVHHATNTSQKRPNPAAARCFQEFNPSTKELYATTMKTWTRAYLDLGAKIDKLQT